MRIVGIALTLILTAAFSALGQQRPLLTDDVDITPPGSLNIGVGVDFFQKAKFPLSGINGDLTRIIFRRERRDVKFPAETFSQTKPLDLGEIKKSADARH